MRSLAQLLPYARPYRWNIIGSLVANVLTVVFSTVSITMLFPFLQILFNQKSLLFDAAKPASRFGLGSMLADLNTHFTYMVEHGERGTALVWVCAFIITVIFLKNAFRYAASYLLLPLNTGIERDLRDGLFAKVMRLPLSYFSEQRKGDLIARMTADVQEIQISILSVVSTLISEPLMIIGSLGAMLYISPRLTVFVAVLLGFMGGVIGRLGKNLRRQSADAQQRLGGLLSRMDETLGGLRMIKSFNAEPYQSAQFGSENNGYRNTVMRIARRRELASPLSEFLGVTVFVLLLGYGARLVFSGDMQAAAFMVYLGIFQQIIQPAKAFSTAFYNIRKGLAAKQRIDEIMNAEETITDMPNAQPVEVFERELCLDNVVFRYNDDKTILKGVSLRVPKGKVIALVGASGAGKSTIADLLPRFYDPTDGSVTLDGKDIRTLRLHDLRQLMGIVSQEAILFNDTIRNNIAFGIRDATDEAIYEAARVANAHEFILETEHGYDTRIGDRGTKLSGGQRQRITIARAVLKNPPILILDEATSALDSESEKAVQDALYKLLQNRTAVVIAHRLSTIQHADEIVVMQEGCIIERGTHAELLARSGVYSRLVELQGV